MVSRADTEIEGRGDCSAAWKGRGNGVPAARGLAGLRGQRRPRLRGTSGTLGLYPEGDRKV